MLMVKERYVEGYYNPCGETLFTIYLHLVSLASCYAQCHNDLVTAQVEILQEICYWIAVVALWVTVSSYPYCTY